MTDRTWTAVAGGLYLLTFATSIPALALKESYLRGDGTIAAAQWGGTLEIILAFACIGTAVAVYPVARQADPALALGFVASRVLEAAVIFTGTLAFLGVTTLRDLGALAGEPALVAIHDWAFLLGPGILPAINALCFATLLLRSRLVPRIIPLIGLIGIPFLLASSFGTMFGAIDQVSALAALCALPIALWEFSIGVWLIVRGIAPPAGAAIAAERATAGR